MSVKEEYPTIITIIDITDTNETGSVDQSTYSHNTNNNKKRKIKLEKIESDEPPIKKQRKYNINTNSSANIKPEKDLKPVKEEKNISNNKPICKIKNSILSQICSNLSNKQMKSNKNEDGIRDDFTDYEDSDIEEVENIVQARPQSIKSAYKYNIVYGGLNYNGKCLNKKCKAYLEPIYAWKGYGVTDPSKDVENNFLKCPGCKKIFDLRAVSFYLCNAKIKYKGVDDGDVQIKKVKAIGNDIVEFGDYGMAGGYWKKEKKNIKNESKMNHNSTTSDSSGYSMLIFDVKELK